MSEYARFKRERSLPMFREQRGLVGELFLRERPDRAAPLAIWEDLAAVETLRDSVSYQHTARALVDSGLLMGELTVEIFEIHGGELRSELLGALAE